MSGTVFFTASPDNPLRYVRSDHAAASQGERFTYLIKSQKPRGQTLASDPPTFTRRHGRNSCVAARRSNQIPRSARTIDMG